jgi:FKBP-type peptidyl-prolyl cis-trans isomerase
MKTWIRPFVVPIFLAAAACNSDYTAPAPLLPGEPFSMTDLRVGDGAQVVVGQTVTVNYTGWIYDPTKPENKGTQFDTTSGREPALIPIATGRVIPGWVQGVPGMRVGGLRRLVIPPDLAYGSAGAGNGIIPPNATLIFEIDLLAIQ